MNNDIVLKLEHCIEIQDAIRRNSITPDVLKKITSGDFLARVRDVANGYAVITTIEHLIDCDADPFVPDGWKVEVHQRGGAFKWDPKKVTLWLAKGQKGNNYLQGHKLYEELKNKIEPVLNANVLDYLLKNSHLIPEEWKGKYVFFWGTIYRDSGGDLCVRCLRWDGSRWGWDFSWLDRGFSASHPAALRAS